MSCTCGGTTWRILKLWGSLLTCGRLAIGLPRPGIDSLRSERSQIDREAVFHTGLDQFLIGLVHLLNGDNFDIGGDVMCATKVEHLLCFGDAADGRAGQAPAPEDKTKRRNRERLLRRTDQGEVTVAAEELDVGVDVRSEENTS